MTSEEKNRLIVVLGMHRSGTSSVARALKVLNINLGSSVMVDSASDNKKGFWEDYDIVTFNDRLLSECGKTWESLTPLKESEVELLIERGFLLQAVELLRKKISDNVSFGFKDPRTSKLLYFWSKVFEIAKIRIDYLLVLRNPLSISKSLAKRNGFEPTKSYALFLDHILTSLRHGISRNILCVDYDRLIERPSEEVYRIAKCLNFEVNASELDQYICGFLEHKLRHSSFASGDLSADPGIFRLVSDIYRQLSEGSQSSQFLEAQKFSYLLENWLKEYECLLPCLKLIDKLEEEKKQLLAGSKENFDRVAEVESQLGDLGKRYTEVLEEKSCLARAVSNAEKVAASLEAIIEEKEKESTLLQERTTRAEESINSLLNLVSEIRKSTSWKVTAPLRYVAIVYRHHSPPKRLSVFLSGFQKNVLKAVYFTRQHGFLALLREVKKRRPGIRLSLEKNRGLNFAALFDLYDPEVLKGVPLQFSEKFSTVIPDSHEIAGTNEECNLRVGIFFHAFYVDQIDDFFDLIRERHSFEHFYVTTDTALKRQVIERKFLSRGISNFSVKEVPNRGRDIAPRFIHCRHELTEVDIALFIHTKSSPHIESGKSWRDYLWGNIAGTPELRKNIRSFFHSTPELGMLAPEHWPDLTRFQPVNWGHNFAKAQDLVKRAGGELLATTPLEFPSGSMFWARSAALTKIFELDLRASDFEIEAGQVDGTVAHAIERSMFYFCELSGFRWLKFITQDTPRLRSLPARKKFPNLLFNEQKFGAIEAVYPETAGLPFFIESLPETRLNLLIPTLRRSHVYGGIKTAVSLFSSIVNQLSRSHSNVRVRVVVTDDRFEPSADHLSKEEINSDFDLSRLQVISVSDRVGSFENLFPLSKSDIFFASAWWNAAQAQRFQSIQRTLFGEEQDFIYLVQDYEPGFYPWSSKSALADTTYSSSLSTIHIVNDRFLYEHLRSRKLERCLCLDFSVNDILKRSLLSMKHIPERENILLFYGRPSVERNCFELILDALCMWATRLPGEFAKWEIYSAGELFSEDNIPEFLRGKIKIVGKLSISDYANLLCKAKIGVSLMQSPHPSYPPQEMASVGMSVVTNDWQEKKWSERSGGYFVPKSLRPSDICDAIISAARFPCAAFKRNLIEGIPDQTQANDSIAAKIVDILRCNALSP